MARRGSIRSKSALAATLGGLILLAAGAVNAQDMVLRNPSPSVPAGYYLRTSAGLAPGAFVTVRAVDVAPGYAAMRGFTDSSDSLIKRVAAAAGDEVCANGADVSINGAVIAHREAHDAAGRALPTWSGCRTLSANEILLLGDTPDSFDGRYWGVIPRRIVEGVWRPTATSGG